MNTPEYLKDIENKTVLKIEINGDKTALLFHTTEGIVPAYVYAECYSETFIQHTELPSLGFPCNILSVKDTLYSSSQYGETKVYGLELVTDKGLLRIEYRNESEGAYEGGIIFPSFKGFEYYKRADVNFTLLTEF